MYTADEFTYRWQRLHHPSMDVSGDAAFFYELYGRLHRLVGEGARGLGESVIRSLLLYAENETAIGFDGVYEYRYRSLGDVVGRFCGRLGMTAGAVSQVHRLLSEAVAQAPGSSLRRWMTESVLSHDFLHLGGMLAWFVRKDVCLRLVRPGLSFRKAMFRRLTGDRPVAGRMRLADLAFNWRDKRGCSLAAVIAGRCRSLSAFPLTDEAEQPLLRDVADALDTVRSERLDTYTVIGREDGHTLTLRHRDGRVFNGVAFFTPVPDTGTECHLTAQLVTYLGRTYVNGPFQWVDSGKAGDWNGSRIWTDIIHREQEAARQRYFTTAFGKRICLYDDLYTVPEDPGEADDADWGIYRDEPDIFDFLELFGRLKRNAAQEA